MTPKEMLRPFRFTESFAYRVWGHTHEISNRYGIIITQAITYYYASMETPDVIPDIAYVDGMPRKYRDLWAVALDRIHENIEAYYNELTRKDNGS